jgi:FkbM family methyltransferase
MNKSNIVTKIFQYIIRNKDIRTFKKNNFYYLFFRSIRRFLNNYVEIKIYNFKILASNKKNQTSHALLKKCNFDDQHELETIKKFSNNKKIFLLDCGCNYGFYSFYTASLSNDNFIISFEASPRTSEDFNKNLYLNNFKNIIFNNLAISNADNHKVSFNESLNDWESSLSHNKFEEKKLTTVNTTTIDTTLKEYDLDNYFLFIKLDIEGHEFQAIKGGNNIIKKYNPIIIIEFSKYIFENNKDSFVFLEEFLIEFNYCIYGTNKKLITVKEIKILIENLNPDHKTIGNYYLLKNDKDLIDLFKDG